MSPAPSTSPAVCYLPGFFALIDLVSSLPAIFSMLGAADLRTLRRLRLLRILKPTRHVMIFNCPARCSGAKPAQPRAVLFLLAPTLTISASLM